MFHGDKWSSVFCCCFLTTCSYVWVWMCLPALKVLMFSHPFRGRRNQHRPLLWIMVLLGIALSAFCITGFVLIEMFLNGQESSVQTWNTFGDCRCVCMHVYLCVCINLHLTSLCLSVWDALHRTPREVGQRTCTDKEYHACTLHSIAFLLLLFWVGKKPPPF